MKPWRNWTFFAVCSFVALLAMAWVSWTVLALEQRDEESRQQAVREENIRLALWRMDSYMAALLSQEHARPYSQYQSFYPLERAYTRTYSCLDNGAVLVPSPLLNLDDPDVLIHFQSSAQGQLSSPQLPQGPMFEAAIGTLFKAHEVEASKQALARVNQVFEREAVLETLRVSPPSLERLLPKVIKTPRQTWNTNADDQQRARSKSEKNARTVSQYMAQGLANQSRRGVLTTPERVEVGFMRALWLADELVLARRVVMDDQEYIQGCLLNWRGLRKALLTAIQDLLPNAHLKRVRGHEPGTHQLIALPVRLESGPIEVAGSGSITPLRLSLVVAWACVVLAVGAVALLLSGVMSLSERRGAFVSAVTHELRTPLTTFRMYTEMLAEGMVSEDKRGKYLQVLKREADRLGHLVNNVLAFARLESGKGGLRHERLAVGELMDRMLPHMQHRAEQGGGRFMVESSRALLGQTLDTDPNAIEQILLNLVDNACKYGKGKDGDSDICFEVSSDGSRVFLTVRDQGPGILARERGRIFTPFFKSAHEAATSAPGVGLGLSLSQRLARQLGGSLHYVEDYKDGAAFSLALNIA